jgi:hypothetical protein
MKAKSVDERFWSRVEKTDRCWNWLLGCDKDGYGFFFVSAEKSNVKAHRFAYSLLHPEEDIVGKLILHSCDNPKCVNPAHLSSGTAQDNMNDKMKRGRWKGGRPSGSKCSQKFKRNHKPTLLLTSVLDEQK